MTPGVVMMSASVVPSTSPSAAMFSARRCPVVVFGVGRAGRQRHRPERQHGGDHIAGGLDPSRYQREAAGSQVDRTHVHDRITHPSCVHPRPLAARHQLGSVA
jgi:hypothetical protein